MWLNCIFDFLCVFEQICYLWLCSFSVCNRVPWCSAWFTGSALLEWQPAGMCSPISLWSAQSHWTLPLKVSSLVCLPAPTCPSSYFTLLLLIQIFKSYKPQNCFFVNNIWDMQARHCSYRPIFVGEKSCVYFPEIQSQNSTQQCSVQCCIEAWKSTGREKCGRNRCPRSRDDHSLEMIFRTRKGLKMSRLRLVSVCNKPLHTDVIRKGDIAVGHMTNNIQSNQTYIAQTKEKLKICQWCILLASHKKKNKNVDKPQKQHKKPN